MADHPQFDLIAAHKHFSTAYFNKTWEYIENINRSEEEDMAMLHTAIASVFHWAQREDATPQNLSVGYWQVSRVYNLIKQPDNARRYGVLALKYAEDLGPFFKGYAYETLARAEFQCNNHVVMLFYLEKAHEMANLIANEEDRQLLMKDLESIK